MTGYTERYIAATVRTLPQELRPDVRAELEASIADAVDGRVAEGASGADAERAVLTELGDPDRLAAGYADRRLELIGPRHFLAWRRLLVLLWWIVVPIAMVGAAIGAVLGDPGSTGIDGTTALVGAIVQAVIVTGVGAVVHVAFWTTAVFAILERTRAGAGGGDAWTVDALPEPDGDGAGRGDVVSSVVLSLALAGALIWDQLIGFARTPERWLPVLDPALWPVGIGWLVAALAAGALVSIAVYASGGWTRALAWLNAAVAAAVAVPAAVAMATGPVLNPAFADAFLPEPARTAVVVVAAAGLLGGAAWSAIDGLRKAGRARSGA